jgi:hypothetical protein
MWCVNPKEGLRVATLLWQVGFCHFRKNGIFFYNGQSEDIK